MYVKESLDQIVYKRFIEGFYACAYHPGEKIDPADIAEKFGMSRTPVVQALKRLAHEKILGVKANGRFFVPVPTEQKLKNICHTRLLFEKEAIHQLLSDQNQGTIQSLYQMAEYCRGNLVNSTVESVKQDLDFHRALVASTGNACMSELYGVVLNRFIAIKYVLSGQYTTQDGAVDRHVELMRYIVEKDETKAFTCIGYHILKSMELLIAVINDNMVKMDADDVG